MTTKMRAWRTHEYGNPAEVLKLDEVEIPEPEEDEVRVRALGIPLNLNDLERITGGNMMVRPDLPYSPGMEVMGIVDACGTGAEALAGKRVVAITRQAHGGFAEYSICPAVSTFEMPEEIALPDAAALFFPFHLAWLGLFDRAELQAGETVLVHAAAGGAGSAAVQLAVDAGAHVIATVGSDKKVALCRDLGAETVINYRTDDFKPIVLEQTAILVEGEKRRRDSYGARVWGANEKLCRAALLGPRVLRQDRRSRRRGDPQLHTPPGEGGREVGTAWAVEVSRHRNGGSKSWGRVSVPV